MSNKKFRKSYSLNIDFLDYEKRRDVTRNIVYSEGDRNTAFIHATLLIGGEVIDLENHIVTVAIKNSKEERITNGCEVVSAKEGKVIIPFNSTALTKKGFNKFEVIIYKGENKLVSPVFTYRVEESISKNNSDIENSNNYDVLLHLMSQVQGVIDSVEDTADRVENLEQEMITNEEERKSNENQRESGENIRLSNEAIRQSQEENRQNVFNEKITEINELTSGIRNDLDDKTQQVDRELTLMIGVFNEKVDSVDSKIEEVEDKIVEIDSNISNKLIQLDKDVENTLNTKIDSKMVEIEGQIDEKLNEKTMEKFEEVDETLLQSLLENERKIDSKVSEFTQNVNEKIQEIDTAISRNTEKVDNKIIEVETSKNQLMSEVGAKIGEVNTSVAEANAVIVEVNVAKEELSTTINNKINDFENRFSSLESSNPLGEITQSRIALDGTIQETLSKRLKYDYDKKADKNNTYTKAEIDSRIEGITSVNDATTSAQSTWSSRKINEELNKRETVEGSQNKVNQAIRESKDYTDARVAELVGQSPDLLDTLEELSNALGNDPNFATTVVDKIALKADRDSVYSKDEVDGIVRNATSINDGSTSTTTTWSSNKINLEINKKVSKEEGKGLSTNDFTNAEKNKLSGLVNYVHPNDGNTRHVTDAQISNWNGKAESNHMHDDVYARKNGTTFTGLVVTERDGEAQRLQPSSPNAACYYAFFKNKTNRSGYFGYESMSHSHFVIANEADDANIVFKTRGSGKVRINGVDIATVNDIHTHANKTVLDGITQEKINSWNNKSNFSGAYQDLTGLPTIPTVDVNKNYVDTELGKKANLTEVYTRAEVDNLLNTTSSAYTTLIPSTQWRQESANNYTFELTHNLNSDKLFVSALDNTTKEGMLVGYKIINKSTVLITCTEQVDCSLTLISGGRVTSRELRSNENSSQASYHVIEALQANIQELNKKVQHMEALIDSLVKKA